VRRIVLSSEAVGSDPLAFSADLSSDGLATVQLRSGDRLAGRVESLDQNSLKLEIAGESIDTPTDSVAAVSLPGPPSQAVAAVLVGIADGSLLRAESVSLVDGGVRVVLVGGVELKCDAEQLAFVQPLAGQARYLSDLDAIDYRHTPYLDIAWPYSRDRGLRGQPLVGGGVRSVKGLAMHSAARLVYRLDGSAQRFHAEVAVADPAPDASGGKGLIARVYLARDGKFEPVYDSGELQAGDPAAPVRIDAKGAVGIALVVDYGAGGDAGDECLWLDARLVPGS
jgi:hypothetical protein